MGVRTSRIRTLASALVQEARAENVTFMAGSIAYHAFVSLLPLLLFLLTVASVVGNRTLEESLIAVASTLLTRGAGDMLVAQLQDARRSTGVSLLGLAVLLWGTLRIFRGLDTAFSDIYETTAENTFVDQIADSVVVLVTFALAIFLGGTIQTDVLATGVSPLDWLVGHVVAVAVLAAAFLPMYYLFPDEDVTLREIVPGAVFAAVGLTALESLFGFYLEFSGQSQEANVVAGVVILLTWLYFSGLVILLGVVCNAVLANRSRDIEVRPVFGSQEDRDGPVDATREELVETAERLEEVLADGESITLVAGDREVDVLPPTHVISDTDPPLLFAENRPVGLELHWTPMPEEDRDDGR